MNSGLASQSKETLILDYRQSCQNDEGVTLKKLHVYERIMHLGDMDKIWIYVL